MLSAMALGMLPSSPYISRALMPAFWMKMGAPESVWPLHLVSPAMRSGCPTAYPSLNPVMLNVFENDPNSIASGPTWRMDGA